MRHHHTQYFLSLQQNQIKCIENLECLTNLRFLTLSGNQIEVVEGLKHLQHLFFLDLSLNLIKDFDIGKTVVHAWTYRYLLTYPPCALNDTLNFKYIMNRLVKPFFF